MDIFKNLSVNFHHAVQCPLYGFQAWAYYADFCKIWEAQYQAQYLKLKFG